jgi:endonuclease/exonuclease/phosphatase family metal-dependent hydrolase
MYFIIVLLFGTLSIASAQDFQVGQQIILQAKKPIGVPLHREPAPSYLKHIPSGTTAVIQRIAQNGHWLSIQLEAGDSSWVHKKYVRAGTPTVGTPNIPVPQKAPTTSKTILGGEDQVWTNKALCKSAIQQGLRMAEPSLATLRVATWNVRWFPTGTAPDQNQGPTAPTDLDWLTCAIQWMQVDVLAIQEILATPEATHALKTLTRQLSAQTGDAWRWHRQPCGRPNNHHVGLLWNDSRVSLSKFDSLWQLNAKASSPRNPCASGLRPGQYAYVESREKNGADFHLIAVHLKSGPNVFALETRQKAFNRIDKAVASLLKRDRDVVILGDFNTMGAGDRQSQRSELKYLRRFVAKEKPGFSDLAVHPQCSHYFRGRAGQLDHILVTKGMKEVAVTSIQVTGYCALADCQRIRGDYPLAYRRLSDHCPVVLEIENTDQD